MFISVSHDAPDFGDVFMRIPRALWSGFATLLPPATGSSQSIGWLGKSRMLADLHEDMDAMSGLSELAPLLGLVASHPVRSI